MSWKHRIICNVLNKCKQLLFRFLLSKILVLRNEWDILAIILLVNFLFIT